MLFNSMTFAVFFVLVLIFYRRLKHSFRSQNIMLLIASYVFYGWWDFRFLFLLVFCTLTAYCFSLLIDRQTIGYRCYLKIASVLVVSAFLCTAVHWKAVHFHLSGFLPVVSIEWNDVLPNQMQGYWILVISLLVAVVLGICLYGVPGFQRANPQVHLGICIVVNIAVLCIFKYFNFFTDSFISFWNSIGLHPLPQLAEKIILPIGISFFTFQAISYTVDVYRKEIPATASLVEIAVFKAFFPQLVAGPIERGAHLVPQFQKARTIVKEEFKEGLWLIFWGLYKKVVIADNVAVLVNAAFSPYDQSSFSIVPEDGIRCLLAIYAFAIQIYCDFSGYTDIARGVAQLMGFKFILNFNLPYIAVSPSDFWKRWHISLSSWLRDYLYIPLGGNRGSSWNIYRNLVLTMLLGGLWHGAAWTFVLWGAFHGFILVIYRIVNIRDEWLTRTAVRRLIAVVVMFHLICFGWLLFRAQNMTAVSVFLRSILGHFHGSAETLDMLKTLLFYSWFLILFQGIQIYTKTLNPMKNMNWFVRLNIWLFIIMSILTLSPQKAREFIYFAF